MQCITTIERKWNNESCDRNNKTYKNNRVETIATTTKPTGAPTKTKCCQSCDSGVQNNMWTKHNKQSTNWERVKKPKTRFWLEYIRVVYWWM